MADTHKPNKKKKTHGGQNKIELTPEGIQKAGQMKAAGWSHDGIARHFGISERTFDVMMQSNSELARAIRMAEDIVHTDIEDTAAKMAKSGMFPTMTQFWLRTRRRWRTTDHIELTGLDGKPIEIVDKDAAKKIAKAALSALDHEEDE